MEDSFQCSIWFNSNKELMKKKLFDTDKNSGVGIHIGKCIEYFKQSPAEVKLKFDDGTTGSANRAKDSWNECTHLIDESIGLWARKNKQI